MTLNPSLLIGAALLAIVVSVVAGIYPADEGGPIGAAGNAAVGLNPSKRAPPTAARSPWAAIGTSPTRTCPDILSL